MYPNYIKPFIVVYVALATYYVLVFAKLTHSECLKRSKKK